MGTTLQRKFEEIEGTYARMTPSRPAIVWFRDDLRLSDHPALHAAAKHARIGCRAFTCSTTRRRASGRLAARRAGGWRSRCAPCKRACRSVGLRWCCARDPQPRSSPRWRARPVPRRVYWNEIAQAPHRAVADQVAAALGEIGVAAQRLPGDLLAAPSQIRNKENRGLRVFTPFWRRVQALGDPPKPLPAPKKLNGVPNLASDTLEDWQLEPVAARLGRRPARELAARRSIGAGAAQGTSSRTVSPAMPSDRDRPDRDGTSRLSPHLRFGEISPRQVWHAARFAAAEHPRLSGDIDKFLSELGWREFCRHLLFDVPDLATRNLQPAFDALSMEARRQGIAARGSAAGPATRSSMPACANSGTPA